ncbi:traB family domain-containing protein [Ditylenchus destructor]|uniref:Metalloprotease TIKI homolog n=1 Tax=Ditylenchus destructor TaxID=166010 RepID=A0AAD4R996_9BILA|nr:traB family domain-containing protein [Ditylenchus destructor]
MLIDMEQLSNSRNQLLGNCSTKKDETSLFLWRIDSPTPLSVRSYLFGTIHVPYDLVWDYVSDKVRTAFLNAKSVVFELELQNPDTIETLLACKNLAQHETLKDVLPTKIYERIKYYMKRFKTRLIQRSQTNRHIRYAKSDARKEARRLFSSIAGDWELKRPVWMLFLLYQMSETFSQQEQTSPMLDVFLAQKAQELGKKLHSIETPAEQCNPILSISQEQVLFALNYTLSYLEWIDESQKYAQIEDGENGLPKNTLWDLIKHYRCGSLKESVFSSRRFVQNNFTITPETDSMARQIDKLMVEDIILKRNERMASRVHNLLQTDHSISHFFALGAGHFLGERSLITELEKYGYIVDGVKADDEILGHHENFHFSSKFNELWVRDLQMNANTMQRTTESDLTLNAYSRIVLEGPELESPQITISLYEVPNESPNLAPKCYPTNLLFLTLVAFSYISYRRKITL